MPREFFRGFIRYNMKKCKGMPSFIRIHFSSYYITAINKNTRFMDASGRIADLHPGRHILVLLKCSSAVLSLWQQPRTGNQHMENKVYICLEDVCFSPDLTELFLFLYLPLVPKEKVFGSKSGGKSCCYYWNKTPSSPMGSWRPWCSVELWDAQCWIIT